MSITTNFVLLATVLGGDPGTTPPRYPTELPGFKFHATAKWKELIPLQSDFNDVRKVLGDPTNFDEAAGYFYLQDDVENQPAYARSLGLEGEHNRS